MESSLRSIDKESRECCQASGRDVRIIHHRESLDWLRQHLQEAEEKLRATALSELDEAIRMIELLKEENLNLRGEVKRLRKQLEERTRVAIHVPATHSQTPQLALVKREEGSRVVEDE